MASNNASNKAATEEPEPAPQPDDASSSTAAASNDPALDPAAKPATDEGARFVAICASLDRLKQGVVDRVKAERALNSDECASLALATPASACLAALAKHACGREGRYVRYAPLALDLEAAAEEAETVAKTLERKFRKGGVGGKCAARLCAMARGADPGAVPGTVSAASLVETAREEGQ